MLSGIITGLATIAIFTSTQVIQCSHKYRVYCVSAVQGVSIITVQKVFPSLVSGLGQHGTYWLFAAVAASSNIFFYFCVPETKGKL